MKSLKLYSLLLVSILLFGFLYLFFTKPDKIIIAPDASFVSIKDNQFFVNDTLFYPVAMNYSIDLQSNTADEMWVCPNSSYYANNTITVVDRDSAELLLRADMQLMKQNGINTLRIVGAEPSIHDETRQLEIPTFRSPQERKYYSLFHEGVYDHYFSALQNFFDLADSEGMKIIFLVTVKPEEYIRTHHLKQVLNTFKDDPTIMAYDLFNEPLYFDSLQRPKKDIYPITSHYGKIVKEHAPKQLSTIGLAGVREIFEWDPNLINLDFLSFHPYEYEKNQVFNELYWYYKHVDKPWIIGETAIPANNDSVPYTAQKAFADITQRQAFNCGAMGYSWWQYRDVEWGDYHQNYMGMVSGFGDTVTAKGLPVRGSVKPVAESFSSFSKYAEKQPCNCADNYYDYTDNNSFVITGKIVDEANNPIPGAAILAWDEWWTSSYVSVVKEDGSFYLTSDYPFFHWMISGPYHTRMYEDVTPDQVKTNAYGIPQIDLGTLTLSKVELIE